MILRSDRNPRQNIKKQPGNGSLFPLGLMFILVTIILVAYIYRRNLIEFNYNNINNALTSSLLGGCVPNLFEYAESGNLIIQDSLTPSVDDGYFLHSMALFEECLKCNLDLDDGFNILSDRGIKGTVHIEEYRVFNVIKDGTQMAVIELAMVNGNIYVIQYPAGEAVSIQTTDGVKEVLETSVYARISFTLEIMGYSSWMDDSITEDMMEGTYSLSRLVGVSER